MFRMATLGKFLCIAALSLMLSVRFGYTCSPPPPSLVPVYLSYAELRQTVVAEVPRPMTETGNFLVYGDWLLVNEPDQGIHVIDNADPRAPLSAAFIPIPGNSQMTVRGDILYVDSYVDLLAIDLSDPAQAREVNRLQDLFDFIQIDDPLIEADFYYWDVTPDPSLGVVIDYEYAAGSAAPAAACGGVLAGGGGGGCSGGSANNAIPAASAPPPEVYSQNGSITRFITGDEHLYVIDRDTLNAIDISDPDLLAVTSQQLVLNRAETVYVHGTALLVGGASGVDLYDLSDPAVPLIASSFSHPWQCDPVIAQGDVAYVTLRSGVGCGGFLDQLDILDVADIANPQLIASYPMSNPHGLAIDGNLLFVADGGAGVSVLDVADPTTVNVRARLQGFHARDTIAVDGVLMVVGLDGIRQFDYSDPTAPIELSAIETAM